MEPQSQTPLIAAPPSAAEAFEALRREVVSMHETILAQRTAARAAPDYSETLGVLAGDLNTAARKIDWLTRRAAITLTPEEMARQIKAAGAEVRTTDRQAVHEAADRLTRATAELRGWIDTARLASAQNWRLAQTALAGLVMGAMLGMSFPVIVAQAAPEAWAWPEALAARALHRDQAAAGERLLSVAAPRRWRDMRDGLRIVEGNRERLARCQRTLDSRRSSARCVILLDQTRPST